MAGAWYPAILAALHLLPLVASSLTIPAVVFEQQNEPAIDLHECIALYVAVSTRPRPRPNIPSSVPTGNEPMADPQQTAFSISWSLYEAATLILLEACGSSCPRRFGLLQRPSPSIRAAAQVVAIALLVFGVVFLLYGDWEHKRGTSGGPQDGLSTLDLLMYGGPPWIITVCLAWSVLPSPLEKLREMRGSTNHDWLLL